MKRLFWYYMPVRHLRDETKLHRPKIKLLGNIELFLKRSDSSWATNVRIYRFVVQNDE